VATKVATSVPSHRGHASSPSEGRVVGWVEEVAGSASDFRAVACVVSGEECRR